MTMATRLWEVRHQWPADLAEALIETAAELAGAAETGEPGPPEAGSGPTPPEEAPDGEAPGDEESPEEESDEPDHEAPGDEESLEEAPAEEVLPEEDFEAPDDQTLDEVAPGDSPFEAAPWDSPLEAAEPPAGDSIPDEAGFEASARTDPAIHAAAQIAPAKTERDKPARGKTIPETVVRERIVHPLARFDPDTLELLPTGAGVEVVQSLVMELDPEIPGLPDIPPRRLRVELERPLGAWSSVKPIKSLAIDFSARVFDPPRPGSRPGRLRVDLERPIGTIGDHPEPQRTITISLEWLEPESPPEDGGAGEGPPKRRGRPPKIRPSESLPSESRPLESHSAVNQPPEDRPAEGQPTGDRPRDDPPAD
jgi:hypothetical protein